MISPGNLTDSCSYLDRLIVITTDLCDSRCRACRIWKIEEPTSLEPETLLARAAESHLLSKLRRVNISGGEPFQYLGLDRLTTGLRALYGEELLFSCITNGLQPGVALRWAERQSDLGRLQLFVSIDGFDPPTYLRTRGLQNGLDQAISTLEGLRRLRTRRPHLRVGVSFTIMKQNYHQLYRAHELTQELGVDLIARVAGVHPPFYRVASEHPGFRLSLEELDSVQRVLEQIISERELTEAQRFFFSNMKKGNLASRRDYDCFASRKSYCVRSNGDVVPCLFQDWKIGNIYTDTFDSMMTSAAASSVRNRVQCRECNCWNDSERLASYEYSHLGGSPDAGW